MEYGWVEPLKRKEGVSNSYQTMMAKERFVKQAVPIPIHDSLASLFFENWTSEAKRMGSGTKIDDFPHSKSGTRTSRAPKSRVK